MTDDQETTVPLLENTDDSTISDFRPSEDYSASYRVHQNKFSNKQCFSDAKKQYYENKYFLHDVYELISINSDEEISEPAQNAGVLRIGLLNNYIVSTKINEPIEEKFEINIFPLLFIFSFFFLAMIGLYGYVFSCAFGPTWIQNIFGLFFIVIIYFIKLWNLTKAMQLDNMRVNAKDIIIGIAVYTFIVGFTLFPFNYIYKKSSRGSGNDEKVWIEKTVIIICMIVILVLLLVYDFLIKFQMYKLNKYILNFKNEFMYNSLILIPKPHLIVSQHVIELSKKQRELGKNCLLCSSISFLFASFILVQFLSNYENDKVWGSITSANFVSLLLISITDLWAVVRVITLEEIIKLSKDVNDEELKSVEGKVNWNYRDVLSIIGGIIGIVGSIFAKLS